MKPGRLNELLGSARGRDNEILVRYLALRSLPQARYSAVNEGHFGLVRPAIPISLRQSGVIRTW